MQGRPPRSRSSHYPRDRSPPRHRLPPRSSSSAPQAVILDRRSLRRPPPLPSQMLLSRRLYEERRTEIERRLRAFDPRTLPSREVIRRRVEDEILARHRNLDMARQHHDRERQRSTRDSGQAAQISRPAQAKFVLTREAELSLTDFKRNGSAKLLNNSLDLTAIQTAIDTLRYNRPEALGIAYGRKNADPTKPVSVLFISNGTKSYVFRLLSWKQAPKELVDLLRDESIVKFMCQSIDELSRPFEKLGITLRGVVQSGSLVRQLGGAFPDTFTSHFALFTSQRISLTQAVSDWESQKLTPQQAAYAAAFAQGTLYLGKKLVEVFRKEHRVPTDQSLLHVVQHHNLLHDGFTDDSASIVCNDGCPYPTQLSDCTAGCKPPKQLLGEWLQVLKLPSDSVSYTNYKRNMHGYLLQAEFEGKSFRHSKPYATKAEAVQFLALKILHSIHSPPFSVHLYEPASQRVKQLCKKLQIPDQYHPTCSTNCVQGVWSATATYYYPGPRYDRLSSAEAALHQRKAVIEGFRGESSAEEAIMELILDFLMEYQRQAGFNAKKRKLEPHKLVLCGPAQPQSQEQRQQQHRAKNNSGSNNDNNEATKGGTRKRRRPRRRRRKKNN